MIHEVATIEVTAGSEDAFVDAVRTAVPLFAAAKGFLSVGLQRSIEHPQRYHLIIGWKTVDDHMIHFRNSTSYAKWRDLAGPFFAAPPVVEHVETIAL